MLAYIGISLYLISFLVFFLPENILPLKMILFTGIWMVGTGLILLFIFLTGKVPIRGPKPWPDFKEKPFSAVFGLIIYLLLFLVCAWKFIEFFTKIL